MKSLVYSENLGLVKELCSASKLLGETTVFVLNDDATVSSVTAMGFDVVHSQDASISAADTAALAKLVADVAKNIDAEVVLLASNKRGKELAGRVGFELEAGCLVDVNAITFEGGKILCERNALGGATIATQSITTDKKVIAISAKTFDPCEDSGQGSVTDFSGEYTPTVAVKGFSAKEKDSVDVDAADFLIAIGQGVEDQAYVEVAETIAAKFGGAVACTKPVATDKKWFDEDRIIGLSGVTCKPALAIVFGISGQVQFSVGIRDAKKIICVNTDEAADMIKMSDYWLTADAEEVLQKLKEAF